MVGRVLVKGLLMRVVTVAVIAALTSTLLSLSAPAESIQMVFRDGTYMVPVRINDAITLPFVLDSGASSVVIPADVFLTLNRTGTINKSDFIGTVTIVLADGSEQSGEKFLLSKVSVGDHLITNVEATVVSVRGDPLLGQAFLSKLPAWTIDNERHTLSFHDRGDIAGTQRDVTPLSNQLTC
jgi:clan AA aspartic protease (TIGR02281 family)